MAVTTGAFGSSNAVTAARAATFIPEIWSDEIIAAYEKNLIMANLVRKMSMKGKKGDTLHIPMPTRGAANAKVADTMVRIQQDTESEVVVTINRHFEYSRLIEDIVATQALSSLRQFYTSDAGYALSRQVDTDLIQLGRQANNGAGTNVYATAYTGGDGATAYVAASNNETALTDPGIRRVIQRLDDNDVPMDQRYLVIPPSSRNTLMGIARFTEQSFVGEAGSGNTIRNGKIGDVYGVEVFVTPQCDTASGTNAARVALMFHRDAFVLATQMGVRSQTQYKQEYLGDLFTSDILYGMQILRKGNDVDVPTSAFAIAVPA
jgi:N4-gp56 family major capsid protein